MTDLLPSTIKVELAGADLVERLHAIRSDSDESPRQLSCRQWDCPRYRGGSVRLRMGDADMLEVRRLHAAGSPVDLRLPWSETYYRRYIGVGDGVEITWDLPTASTTARTIRVAGSTTPTMISAGTGDNDRDQITFGAAPAAGSLIEGDLTGELIIRCQPPVTIAPEQVGSTSWRVEWPLEEV
jgi:hypothetical protein